MQHLRDLLTTFAALASETLLTAASVAVVQIYTRAVVLTERRFGVSLVAVWTKHIDQMVTDQFAHDQAGRQLSSSLSTLDYYLPRWSHQHKHSCLNYNHVQFFKY